MKQYIIGHRGAAGLAPENTLASFKVGIEKGADVVECDIHLTKDKQLVVIHDGTLYRTTNGEGWVKDYTLEELKKLDAGNGEKIPTLQEVVDLVTSHHKKLIIEIKAEDDVIAEELTNVFLEYLSHHTEIIPYLYVHSFWHEVVKKVKQIYPEINTSVIIDVGLSAEKLFQLILDAKANGASISQDFITPKLVELCHAHHLELNAWVLNDTESFEKMKNLGVEGLTTNFPGRFQL